MPTAKQRYFNTPIEIIREYQEDKNQILSHNSCGLVWIAGPSGCPLRIDLISGYDENQVQALVHKSGSLDPDLENILYCPNLMWMNLTECPVPSGLEE